MILRFWLVAGCVLITSVIRAQSFRLQARVDTVRQSGYYRILLPVDVVGQLNPNLTDIRLFASQQEIPYLLVQKPPVPATRFVEYELAMRTIQPHASTTLLIRNRAKSRISSLALVIRNTNVRKKLRLSGSTDTQNWYAIDDEIWLEPNSGHAAPTDTLTIHFPVNDYEYYQLVLNDSISTPLNILRIGYYQSTAQRGTYSVLPNLLLSQRDSSNQKTYIRLSRATATHFDKLIFVLNQSTPFHRRAEVGLITTRKKKHGHIEKWFEPIRSIELSSADSNVVYLPGIKTKDLYVVIDNGDSPPLSLRTIKAYQLTTYLLASLTAGTTYHLRFSASGAPAPTYDLSYFRANLPVAPPIIGVGPTTTLSPDTKKAVLWFSDSRIIWPVLGLVLLLLGFFSYRMLNEVSQRTVR
ncbi:hypothetical protein WBJ53_27275 [Spirosoma sp. SC4-14]|uniref:hypothetical protein n=1 Tax=Spirosoma sp. SC4-14 TaxID=3128900 RepID=UPI0030CAC043